MSYQCFTCQFKNDHTGYIQAMTWFSRLQPPAIGDKTWTDCITAMGEAFENTVYHAKMPSGIAPPTSVEVIITNTMIQIRIWDSGPGFNLEHHMKGLPKSVPLHAERGRGLWIINQLTDHLSYNQTKNHLNCFTIQKFWTPSDGEKSMDF